jgi:hypothetical protein
MCVRRRRQGEMRQRITRQTVGACLQEHELGLVSAQVGENTLPGGKEFLVACTRRERDIEFRALGSAGPGLFGKPRSRVQKAPVFVEIRKNQVGVGFIALKHPVPIVHVDVDVGDAPDSVLGAQSVDDSTEVVEHAEPSRAAAACVVHAADWLEGAPRLSPKASPTKSSTCDFMRLFPQSAASKGRSRDFTLYRARNSRSARSGGAD